MALEIARLDVDNKIILVEACSEEDYRTDSVARTVRLESGHDMRKRIGQYVYDFNENKFRVAAVGPLDQADLDTSELVEGLVEAIEDFYSFLSGLDNLPYKFRLSPRTKRSIRAFRRRLPRKEGRVRLDDDLTAAPNIIELNVSMMVRPSL